MKFRRVASILGLVLYALGAAQLVPLPWCLHPTLDVVSALGFGAGAAACGGLGLAMRRFGTRHGELYRREGVLIVVGAWGLASVMGAVPYVATGAIPSPVDALFESVSGFTTTGASILVDIEALPPAVLFWRSFTQWLGGLGLLVIFVGLITEMGPGARLLMKLEVTGPAAKILHARARETAIALFRVYLVMSATQVVVMLALGASLYDALVHTFATVSSGGFSPHADSAGHFGWPIQLVILLFMLAAGVNFSLYYAFFVRRDGRALRNAEMRAYLLLAAASAGVITFDLVTESAVAAGLTGGAGGAAADGVARGARAALDAGFAVVSILTTTGFATVDFTAWPGLSQTLLVMLMFVGGCAGSTAGGFKVIRVLAAWRSALRDVRLTFSPNAAIALRVGDTLVSRETMQAVASLFTLWAFAWAVGAVALSVGGVDFLTAATASIATLSNVGPGLGDVGPSGNFAFFLPWQKGLMAFLMLLGRLEFFAVLAVFLPRFWRG